MKVIINFNPLAHPNSCFDFHIVYLIEYIVTPAQICILSRSPPMKEKMDFVLNLTDIVSGVIYRRLDLADKLSTLDSTL